MPVSVTHPFVSTVSDSGNSSIVQPTNWNADHTITVTEFDVGASSAGTVTPSPTNGPLQRYVNGGAHTLAPGSTVGAYYLTITNNASAGAIATTGWTKVAGDSLTTTNGDKFRCCASIGAGGSLLIVQSMQ